MRRYVVSDYYSSKSSFLHRKGVNTTSALFRASNGDIKLTPDIYMVLEYDDSPMPTLVGDGDIREEIREKFAGGEREGGWTKETLREAMYLADKRITLGDLGVTGDNKDDNVPGLYMPICKIVDGEPVTLYDSDLFPRNYYKWLYRLAYDVDNTAIDWYKVISYGIFPIDSEMVEYKDGYNRLISKMYGQDLGSGEGLEITLVDYDIMPYNMQFVKLVTLMYHGYGLLPCDMKVIKHIKPLLSLIDNSDDKSKKFYEYVLDSMLFLDCAGVYDMMIYAVTMTDIKINEIPTKYQKMYKECLEEIFSDEDLYEVYFSSGNMTAKEIYEISERASDDLRESLNIHREILKRLKAEGGRQKIVDVINIVIKSLDYRIKNAGAGKRDYDANGVIHTAYLTNDGGREGILVVDGVSYQKDYAVVKSTPEKVKRMITYARTGKNPGLGQELTEYVDHWLKDGWRTVGISTTERFPSSAGSRGKGWQ